MKRTLLSKQAPQILLLTISFGLATPILAQYGASPTNLLDHNPAKRPHVRPNDVVWSRTVWRRIDLRQKMNQSMYYPLDPTQGRRSLYDWIIDGVKTERTLNAYSTGPLGLDDMFTTRLTASELDEMISPVITVQRTSIVDGEIEYVEIPDPIESEDIVAYDIKERWYIDAERSELDVMIVGIAPVIAVIDEETGDYRGIKQLFWINYIEARHIMAKWPAFDAHNAVQYLSYDDVFTQRKFHGRITKVSNVYERSLREYLGPMDALEQASAEHEEIRNIELDMWNY